MAYGIACGAYTLFFIYLLLGWRKQPRGAALLLAVGASTLWALANGFVVWSPSTAVLVLAWSADIVRQASWLAFIIILLLAVSARVVRWAIVAAAVVAVGQILGVLGLELRFLSQTTLHLGSFLASAVLGLVLVEQLFRSVPPESRWALKPLCLALSAGYVFELYLFADGFLFGHLDADLWAVRGIAHSLTLPLVAVSAARNPDWALRITVSRDAVFHSTALALSGAYLLVIAAAGYYVRYFGGDWGRALQLTLFFAGLLLLSVFLVSGAQRARLRVFLNKHLFPYRYDYRSEWLRFTQALSSADGTLDLGESVIKGLCDLVESPGGALWLRESGGPRYHVQSRLNHPAIAVTEDEDSSFCQFLAEREWVINLEEYRSGSTSYSSLALPAWLSAIPSAWLVLPLKSGGVLVGFVLLSAPRTPVDVNWEVLDLLKTAQAQAASYLSRMQAVEALIESRKFDSFNRMSAFVVHDLKNLVAQLSLMLKNAERHKHNPAFQEDMLETVANVESRMRALMAQLQEKRSIDPPRRVEIAALIERLRMAKRHQRPAIEFDPGELGMVEVIAHPERLERVIGHVLQNALEATRDDGRVAVRIKPASDGSAVLSVEDNGCGMTKEFVREQLFRPFQTSKTGGMGIGAFEAQQYIREIGGSIAVDSEPGEGTRVSITLPVVAREARDDMNSAVMTQGS
ncbi:Two component system sensor histidine kinase, PEP-CTERM system related [Aromatoleum petrolei]|nr:XrtA/PEP-CTERM system histidine kinase PrsK [Aromatoleum petrolei]QTQ35379.1 Two component system sensor histidine kinase, PEP-CTERM system related [Aromatoleum petrolei]